MFVCICLYVSNITNKTSLKIDKMYFLQYAST